MLPDGKMPVLDEQLEAKESRIIEFEKCEYLAQHIILLTTSARPGAKIKDMLTAEVMWNTIQDDAMLKSMLMRSHNPYPQKFYRLFLPNVTIPMPSAPTQCLSYISPQTPLHIRHPLQL